jgi:hypothetical protein
MNDILSRIVAKSGVSRGELEDRKKKGFTRIEIQLLEKDLITEHNTEESIKILKDAITELGLDIVSIHAPLSSINWYHLIEYISISNNNSLGDKYSSQVYKGTLKLTESIAEYSNKMINLIVHTNLSRYQISTAYKKEMIDNMAYLVYRYPNIRYSIENVTPINDQKCFVQGSFFENVYLCELLQSEINNEYFATTLDTCHALTTCRMIELLEKLNYGYHNINCIDYKNFFRQNQNTCNNIHLSNVENLGFNMGEHGIKFERNSQELVKTLSYIEDFIKDDAYITLEIREKKLDDYLDTKELPEYYTILKETIGNKA